MDKDDAATRGRSTTDDAASDADAGPGDVLELDEVFTALGHPRRRYLLYTLLNGRREETLSELSGHVAAWERGKPVSEVTDEERHHVHASLYHSHVPKLAELGVLKYVRATDIIVRAVHTQQVQAVLNGAGAEIDSRQEKHAQHHETDSEHDE